MDNSNNEPGKQSPLYGVVDERTKAIVYRGDAYGGRFTLFALLGDIFLRGLNLDIPLIHSNWDLLLIVILGSLVSIGYQVKSKVLAGRPPARSFLFLIAIMGLGALVSILIHFLLP